MDTIIDIIGSTIVAGLLILAVVGINVSISNAASDSNVQVITQSDVTAIADGIVYDFYKIGFRASPAILFADTDKISFRADLEEDGTPDTLSYFTAPAPVVAGENPNMIVLFRHIWDSATGQASTTGASLGQTSFELSYYDSTGDSIAIPPGGLSIQGGTKDDSLLSAIRSIRIQVLVQSPNRMISDTTYAGAYWEQYVSPKNLRALM